MQLLRYQQKWRPDMAVQQYLDISMVVRGSRRLNEEKGEINLVLNFLKVHFKDFAKRHIDRLRSEIGTEKPESQSIRNVFSVSDPEGNLFRFDVVGYLVGSPTYTLVYVGACLPEVDCTLLDSLIGNN